MKNDVQQVAIKVIDQTDAQQLAEFAKVIPHVSLLDYIASATHTAFGNVVFCYCVNFDVAQTLHLRLTC